jgi:hypothetical protein
VARPSVYIETTVLSLLTARPSRDLLMAAWQQVTQEWWSTRYGDFELFISDFVVEEAGRGDPGAARRRLTAARKLERLTTTDAVRKLAERLLNEVPLPARAQQDALHVACATVHGMNYLLTWNCTHIANAEFVPAIHRVCLRAGFECPHICTPQELLTIHQ